MKSVTPRAGYGSPVSSDVHRSQPAGGAAPPAAGDSGGALAALARPPHADGGGAAGGHGRSGSLMSNAFEMLDSMTHLPGSISAIPHDTQMDTDQMISAPQRPVVEPGSSSSDLLSPGGSERSGGGGGGGWGRGSQNIPLGGPEDSGDTDTRTTPLLVPGTFEDMLRTQDEDRSHFSTFG